METIQNLQVVYRSTDSLRPYERNSRTHSKKQIQQIAESIRYFGFTNPVLIDGKHMIVAGHGRVAAAKLLHLKEVPTIVLEELSEDQIRAYILADNRLAESAGWDQAILKIELQHLVNLDTNFDVTLTGFEVAEIDLLLQEDDAEDTAEEVPESVGPIINRPGDLWLLGSHRLLCGDVRDPAAIDLLMNSRQADMVFTDPPYNVKISDNVSGKGAVKHEDFAMAVGEMSADEFIRFLTESLGSLAEHSSDGSVQFVCMDWRHIGELLTAGDRVYNTLLNLCIWVKNSGGQGSFYRSRHELVFVFRKGKTTHRNNIQLGSFGRYRTNVWEYPAMSGLTQRQDDEGNLLALHPTVKPVAMVADAILDCSAPGDIVLDGFLGSGSTLIAAEKTRRICCGIELDPKYIDVAIQRWTTLTGCDAIHSASGKSYTALQRESESAHVKVR